MNHSTAQSNDVKSNFVQNSTPATGRSSVCMRTLPAELKAVRQWVNWKFGTERGKNGKLPKIPVNPRTGWNANPTKPGTWHTYDQAITRYRLEKHTISGIGFVFTNDDPYIGIDIDHAFSEGRVKPVIERMLTWLNSYTELSPSKTGFHVIVKGSHVFDRHKFPFGNDADSVCVEVYTAARYFTMSGDIVEPYPGDIQSPDLAVFESRLRRSSCLPASQHAHSPIASAPVSIDDQSILEKALRDDDFKALWNGNLDLYGGDWSRADWSLLRKLAFWTGNDAARMESLFRDSGLYRAKTDTQRGGQTYVQRTIQRAIQHTRTVYRPDYRSAGRAVS